MEYAQARSLTRPRTAEIAVLGLALVIAGAHLMAVEYGAAMQYLLLALAAVVVCAATALGGSRLGLAAAAISVGAVADSALSGDWWALAFELAVMAIAGPLAILAGASIRRQEGEIDEVRRLVRQRIRRLKGEPGYWHRVATTRMGALVTGIEARFIEEALSSERPGVVVDIGAGSGRLEYALTRWSAHVIATEMDDDELRRMEDDERVTPVVVAGLPSLPLRDECVDWLTGIEAPAATDEEWFPLECARVLRPGGGVVLSVYNARSHKGFVAGLRSHRRTRSGVPWANLYYQKDLRAHIERWRAAGFTVQRKQGFYWSPLPRSSNSAWVAPLAMLERALGLRRLHRWSPWVLLELRKS